MMKTKISQYCYIAFLFIFIGISAISIQSPIYKSRSNYRSAQLSKVVTKKNKEEKTEYVDSNGKIMIAADLGYATIIIKETGQEKLEQYYDENGNPISRYTGQYAVLREYDDEGNNIRIIYLDVDGKPYTTTEGYAIETREYNDKRQIKTVKYFDTEGKPVTTRLYGHGRIYEYDDSGNNILVTHINISGQPMQTGQGYASVVRNFYKSEGKDFGRVESEFYYDEKANPKALSLGQYGVHIEYNEFGQARSLTYLDIKGEPIITTKGYTTVVRTYKADNNIYTEQYLDLKGNPVSLSEGQYGIKNQNGQTIYLNQKGQEIINVRNLLNNQSWVIIPSAILLILMSSVFNRKVNCFLLAIYMIGIIYMTILFRDNLEEKTTVFLKYYRLFFASHNARSDIIKNIWLFVPFGAILHRIYPYKRTILITIILSTVIEVIQLIVGIGYCELDDIISNSLGGWIGIMTVELTMKVKLHFCVLLKHIHIIKKA